MNELIKLLIATIILILGIPIGNYLASKTKEELKQGKKWFKIIVIVFSIIGFIGLIIKNDAILFSGFFIAIVTSRSLER
jgi:preprotein translocase subunit Sss1